MCNTEQDGGKSTEDILQLRRSGLVLIRRFLVIPEPCRTPQGPPGLPLLPCSGPQDAARAAAVQKQHPGEERRSGSFSHDHRCVKNSELHKKKLTEEPLKTVCDRILARRKKASKFKNDVQELQRRRPD